MNVRPGQIVNLSRMSDRSICTPVSTKSTIYEDRWRNFDKLMDELQTVVEKQLNPKLNDAFEELRYRVSQAKTRAEDKPVHRISINNDYLEDMHKLNRAWDSLSTASRGNDTTRSRFNLTDRNRLRDLESLERSIRF